MVPICQRGVLSKWVRSADAKAGSERVGRKPVLDGRSMSICLALCRASFPRAEHHGGLPWVVQGPFVLIQVPCQCRCQAPWQPGQGKEVLPEQTTNSKSLLGHKSHQYDLQKKCMPGLQESKILPLQRSAWKYHGEGPGGKRGAGISGPLVPASGKKTTRTQTQTKSKPKMQAQKTPKPPNVYISV